MRRVRNDPTIGPIENNVLLSAHEGSSIELVAGAGVDRRDDRVEGIGELRGILRASAKRETGRACNAGKRDDQADQIDAENPAVYGSQIRRTC
jgi:hypothetical protein